MLEIVQMHQSIGLCLHIRYESFFSSLVVYLSNDWRKKKKKQQNYGIQLHMHSIKFHKWPLPYDRQVKMHSVGIDSK